MNALVHQVSERCIDAALALNAAESREDRALDGQREMAFASWIMAGMTDMHAFYGSGGDDAELNDRLTRLMTSVARFGADHDLDLVPTSRYLYELG